MTDTVEPSRTTGRRRLMVLLASASVLVLVAAGLVGTRLFGLWGDSDPEAQPSPSPTGIPSPFSGTPAEDFAEGAEGIELPPAEPVGDFTADQVADALEQVRDALIAARLDESMLVDHEPSEFLATLAPDLRPALEAAFESTDFGGFATQIAEDASPAPVPPRVAGAISYQLATAGAQDTKVIEVDTRFTWVYAFKSADQQLGSDLAVVRDELVWRVQIGLPWLESSQGLWLVDETSRAWGVDCELYDEGVLQPDDDPVTTLAEQAGAIFDPERPLGAADGC